MNNLHTTITRIVLLGLGLLGLAGLAGVPGLQAQEEGPGGPGGPLCSTCVNVTGCMQLCLPTPPRDDGFNGATCSYARDEEGCLFCNWHGECGVAEEEDLAMLVSPAGTVLDRNAGSLRASNGHLAVTCNGLVVTHLDDGRPRSEAITLLAL